MAEEEAAENLLLCEEDASNVVWNENGNEGEASQEAEDEPSWRRFGFPAMREEDIGVLFEKECLCMPGKGYVDSYKSRRIDIQDRDKAIAWILRVHGFYGFSPLTAHRSINYLDRFLKKRPLEKGKEWMMQLLSVACLSLAAKMEETQVPVLLDLQTEDPVFMFESKTVQRMELMVLSTLDWRMLAVTPFSFLDWFLDMGSKENYEPVGSFDALRKAMADRVEELILETIKVIEFTEHRPSSLAAAALICAVEELLPAEAAADWKETIMSSRFLSRVSYNSLKSLWLQFHFSVAGF
eukprot:TRINITY_DN4863_c0_g1_i1.p1 TRINITY_DN4863_c0_g1~~TRINITY_DN4863_c0_g1_i1.p1  ORF type:complete len:296 (-),score=68.96 TRINITY_DN4863_c0_g1_i1:64-951(-)